MDVYKYFLSGVRNVSQQTIYIIIHGLTAISPRLLNYVKFLSELKYENGKYHTYFGEIKNLVGSFITYWSQTMDDTLKEGDRLANAGLDKAALLKRIKRTIKIRKRMAEAFDVQFLPITTSEQQKIYDELQKGHEMYLAGLDEMKARVEKFDQQEYADEFAKTEFPKSITMKNNVFLYAHTYISMLLADHLAEIRGSLRETLQQSRRNQNALQAETNENLNEMLNLLYEKNKELLMLHRKGLHASVETAELKLEIEKVRKRVTEPCNRVPIMNAQKKSLYFEMTLLKFEKIAATLVQVKAEFENVQREQAMYNSMNTIELPGSKFDCWQNMGQQYEERLALVKENLINAAKSLLTLFCVRGPNRTIYKNNIGQYHMDQFGHQVYNFESGLRLYHRDCDGNFKEAKDEHDYYYDNIGRYFDDKGEKVYQLLECTSLYQIGEDTLLKKVTVDCGHSEAQNKDCGTRIKDPTDVEILPEKHPVDITSRKGSFTCLILPALPTLTTAEKKRRNKLSRTLNSEAVRYLWDGVGAVLPDALYDVGMLQPRNPIHYLAHRLLAHKYSKTKTELREKKKEADAYRAKILRERKEKAAEQKRAWQGTQVPRSELDIDDADGRVAYDIYKATNELICSINFYN